ncbi:MAG TPA: cytochrome c-type biogenesis protein CcmH [Chloroflexota bacterium]
MKRWLGWVAIAWLLLLCALSLAAYGRPAATPSLSDRTLAVARELRCPVCQGESVADSQSGISQGMRAIIRQRLAAGQSPTQIKQYFVSRYGDKILLAPPSSGVGDLAWLAPPLLLGGGVVLLAVLALDWRTRAKAAVPSVSATYLERVRRELNERGDVPG